ncbi:MAG TPA: hypothetical protein DCZ54_02975 [Candidatus Vogelbacteria bacterium]|nr:hypothetical protein [Candidatus Vogelbacteria bacterium]
MLLVIFRGCVGKRTKKIARNTKTSKIGERMSKEKLVLSKLARQHPECATRAKNRANKFLLENEQEIRYLGGRNDLGATISEAVAFGFPPNQSSELAISEGVKPEITAGTTYFFFLFRFVGKRGRIQAELLKLMQSRGRKMVFRPSGHAAIF